MLLLPHTAALNDWSAKWICLFKLLLLLCFTPSALTLTFYQLTVFSTWIIQGHCLEILRIWYWLGALPWPGRQWVDEKCSTESVHCMNKWTLFVTNYLHYLKTHLLYLLYLFFRYCLYFTCLMPKKTTISQVPIKASGQVFSPSTFHTINLVPIKSTSTVKSSINALWFGYRKRPQHKNMECL